MQNDINFLRQDHKPQVALSTNIKRLRLLAYLCIVFVPASAIILALLIFFSPLSYLEKQENDLLASSQTVQTKAAKVAFIEDRIKKATDFIAHEDSYDQIIATILSQLSSDQSMSIAGIAVKNNILTLEVDAPSLLSLQSFEDSLRNLHNNHIADLKFQQLEYTANNDEQSNNDYGLSVSMQVK